MLADMSARPDGKKHPCPDCRVCQNCGEVRCRLCGGWRTKKNASERNAMPNPAPEMSRTFQVGGLTAGFRLESLTPLDGMSMTALRFRHEQSGARLLHLAADDAENLFSIAFRTPPPDDTGLPHILEHSVLCGSRRYPVKDPFVELLKTSLATFLNAFTYPDRTIYPCSSMNGKDFHNLLRVYCDAVFFPLLTEDHFRQEGHHLEWGADGAPLIKGVVYNEMRGVYSDPDGLLDRHIQHTLFGSNAYGRDYGGDPAAIPGLTYEQFTAFHKAYYHPANAWIFTYGGADLKETLAILDGEYLSQFSAASSDASAALDTAIRPLVRWTAPRTATQPYPIDAGEGTQARTDIAVAYATNDCRDGTDNLGMKVVEMYLLDNAASPLRKALIDSKLGEELGGSGHADHQRDTYFIVTLKGSEPDRAEAVEKLVLDTVRAECDRGFDPDKVRSALRFLELASREIRPQYPLRLLDRVFASWLYDSDPLEQVDIAARLDELAAAMRERPNYLEDLARKWLLDNPHRLRLVLVPDKDYAAREDAERAGRLAGIVDKMSPDAIAAARATATNLARAQSEGNSAEALATLPRLALADVNPEPLPLAYSVSSDAGGDFIRVPMHAAGVGYLNLALAVDGLDAGDIDLLPLLCEAVEKTGAAGRDYAEMAAREASCTGALEFSAGLTTHVAGHERAGIKLGIWLKALESDWDEALAVLGERLFHADFADRERLTDIVLQSRMGWRNQIVPSGNAYAGLYAASRLTPALAAAERLSGCSQARRMDRLAADIERQLPSLPDKLAALRGKVLARARLTAACLGTDGAMTRAEGWLAENAGRFGGAGSGNANGNGDGNGGKGAPGGLPFAAATVRRRVGLAAPADVAFAALALPAPALADPAAPALALLGTQLSYGYLWNEIRVKGGAYGARASFDAPRGSFIFSTFRDPNIFRSLDAFAGAAAYVAEEMDLSPAGLEQAIIGAVKTLDAPIRPPTAVATALSRHMGGDTPAFRRGFRAALLGLTADAVRAAAARVFSGAEQGQVCVLASREKLTKENAAAPGRELDIEPLWEAGE